MTDDTTNRTNGSTGRDGGPQVGALAGVIAVVLIIAMVLGVGWVVVRVTEAPAPVEGAIEYGLRGETASAATPEQVMEAARVFLKDEKPGAAEKLLARAVDAWPEHQMLRFLFGETLLVLERKAEALASYEAGIAIGPEHAEFRHAAGTLAADIGRLEDARSHYLMAQKLEPTSAKHPLYLGTVERAIGDEDAARASFVLATKLDPDEPKAWASLAGIALDNNRLSPAKQSIERAIEVDPTNPRWRMVRAQIERRGNDPSAALDILLAMDREIILRDHGVLAELALCFGFLGEPGSAAQWYTDSCAANADDPEAHYQAGLWLERSGQPERAISYAHRAVLLGHELAPALLERLERANPGA